MKNPTSLLSTFWAYFAQTGGRTAQENKLRAARWNA